MTDYHLTDTITLYHIRHTVIKTQRSAYKIIIRRLIPITYTTEMEPENDCPKMNKNRYLFHYQYFNAKIYWSYCPINRVLLVILSNKSFFSLHRLERKLTCSEFNYLVSSDKSIDPVFFCFKQFAFLWFF